MSFLLTLAMFTSAAATSCPATCGGSHTCDHFKTFGFTCSDVEAWGCDCSGCMCEASVKQQAPVVEKMGGACPSSCGGEHTCDYYSPFGFECSDMEAWGCDCSGCACQKSKSSHAVRKLMASPSPVATATPTPVTLPPTTAGPIFPSPLPPLPPPPPSPPPMPPLAPGATAPPTTTFTTTTFTTTTFTTTTTTTTTTTKILTSSFVKITKPLTDKTACSATTAHSPATLASAISATAAETMAAFPAVLSSGTFYTDLRNSLSVAATLGKVTYDFAIVLGGTIYPHTALAPFSDPDSAEFATLEKLLYPAFCGTSKVSDTCSITVGKPSITNPGYSFPVTITTVVAAELVDLPALSTGAFLSAVSAAGTPAVMEALAIGTPASTVTFTVGEAMCSSSVETYVKVTEPVGAEVGTMVATQLGGVKENGLPDVYHGLPSGAPCTADTQCASGSCPLACKESMEPWRRAQIGARSSSSLAPVRTLLFGVGTCTRVCA